MSWISDLFSSSVGSVISAVGDVIDKCSTTDEEKLAMRNELVKIQAKAEIEANRHIEAMESQVTERHEKDMASDSWLSKNIRPLALAFLTVSTMLLTYLTIFILDPDKVALIEPWQELLQILLVTTYAFYFGSRGVEKVHTIKQGGKNAK
jgi:hypothetical protein